MSKLTVQTLGMTAGKWEGLLSGVDGDDAPQICVMLYDKIITEMEPVQNGEGKDWHVSFHLDPQHISSGVQTFLFVTADGKETIGSFPVVAGEALAQDLRAEIDLLRAELDMFKRVFRQHCKDTM